MNRFTYVLSILALSAFTPSAWAHVNSNMSCSNCHNSSSNRMSVTSALTTSAATDPGVTAGIKKFQVLAGSSVGLSAAITNGGGSGDIFALAINNWATATTDTGVLNAAHLLTFTPDATWVARSSGGPYATKGLFTWNGSTTNATYTMSVAANTPADYYLMGFTAAGKDSQEWYQSQPFYVQVITATPEPIAFSGMAAGMLLFARRRP